MVVPDCKRENDIDRDVTENLWPGPQGGSFDIPTSNQESHDRESPAFHQSQVHLNQTPRYEKL